VELTAQGVIADIVAMREAWIQDDGTDVMKFRLGCNQLVGFPRLSYVVQSLGTTHAADSGSAYLTSALFVVSGSQEIKYCRSGKLSLYL